MAAKRRQLKTGFSLVEMLAIVVIGSMTLIAVLSVYRRTQDSVAAINRKLDRTQVPSEVLQKIAEDLDKLISSGPEIKLTIQNKYEEGFQKSQLSIIKTITNVNATNPEDKETVLEEIVWQSGYDFEHNSGSMVLYRGHSGLVFEDKLLDAQRAQWEANYPLIPLCRGLTYFKIEVPRGNDQYQDSWTNPNLPPGVRVTLSFAEPFETVDGTLDVPESEKISRTIAIDRTRKISYRFVPTEYDLESGVDPNDPNSMMEEPEFMDDDAINDDMPAEDDSGKTPEEFLNELNRAK